MVTYEEALGKVVKYSAVVINKLSESKVTYEIMGSVISDIIDMMYRGEFSTGKLVELRNDAYSKLCTETVTLPNIHDAQMLEREFSTIKAVIDFCNCVDWAHDNMDSQLYYKYAPHTKEYRALYWMWEGHKDEFGKDDSIEFTPDKDDTDDTYTYDYSWDVPYVGHEELNGRA